VKISRDEKYKSRGYGFACFEDSESMKKALEIIKEHFEAENFNP
jgi:RNA recognition motif-containing protein